MSKVCPMCGNQIVGFPALSRSDNRTDICSQCGTLEAMADLRPCNGLPRHCYFDAAEGTVMIVRGSSGYYRLSPAYTRKGADALNARWGVSKKDASVMSGKSMFGWGACGSMNTKASAPGTKAKPEPAYTGPYMETTLWGHEILAVYYNWASERFDIIAYRKDLGPGLIYARSYNPITGMWGGADYDQTCGQAKAKGMEVGRCVWSSGTLDQYNWTGESRNASRNVVPRSRTTKVKARSTARKAPVKTKPKPTAKRPVAKKPKASTAKPKPKPKAPVKKPKASKPKASGGASKPKTAAKKPATKKAPARRR